MALAIGTVPKKLSCSELERYLSSDPQFKQTLSTCNKVVYTIGFGQRTLLATPQLRNLIYNDQNGTISPGLLGLGITFPEKVEDSFGNEEYNDGLWKFMLHLNKALTLWSQYAP